MIFIDRTPICFMKCPRPLRAPPPITAPVQAWDGGGVLLLILVRFVSIFALADPIKHSWLYMYTERQKKLITSSECHSLKSKAST